MTYRYPVPQGVEHKGVIFYLHGFGAYCEHNSYLFKMFAEKGYECFALDQRGFGNSGGQRGLFESTEVVYSDIYLFVFRAVEQYKINLQKVPLFLFGKSFGGVLAYNMSIRFPQLFKGIGLLAPFFKHTGDTIENYVYIIKFFNLFKLFYSFNMRDSSKPGYKEYVKKYAYHFDDPKHVSKAKLSSVVLFYDEQQQARSTTTTTPFIIINA